MQEPRAVSFQQVDKSNFFCLKFKNNSYYFGEIAYLDSEGVIFYENPSEIPQISQEEPLNPKDPKHRSPEKDKAPQMEAKSLRKVRHGFGVQVFGSAESDDLRKYEGQWEKDKRNGQGTCYYSDGGCYSGGFLNDLREGFGKMSWDEGWEYEGYWKEGRLHGKGAFKTLEGDILGGEFKNNNFKYKEGVYVYPFVERKEREKMIAVQEERNFKLDSMKIKKQFQFTKVKEASYAKHLIQSSYENQRTPLLIASHSFPAEKEQVLAKLFEANEFFEFNLRQANYLKKNNEIQEYMKTIKENLAQALIKDQYLLINIDDFAKCEEENYDPDIREFYDANSFPSHIWSPKLLSRPEVYEKILKNTKYEKERVKADFSLKVILWSKFKIDHELDDKKLIEIFEKRFSRTISLATVDLLLFISQ